MSENVMDTVKGIKENVSQNSASKRDETSVMLAMMNDRGYEVDVYGSKGKEGTFAPGREFRATISDVMSQAAHIDKRESESLIEGFDFRRNHAETMVAFGKEFINTYMQTGRKMKLGGRATSDVSLSPKECAAGMRPYPQKVGVDANGKAICTRGEVWVDGYNGIKASSPCPQWVNSKKK